MSEEKQKEIKTLKGWEESGKNWDDFCKPGELVDEDVYWYFLRDLPEKRILRSRSHQPISSAETWNTQ